MENPNYAEPNPGGPICTYHERAGRVKKGVIKLLTTMITSRSVYASLESRPLSRKRTGFEAKCMYACTHDTLHPLIWICHPSSLKLVYWYSVPVPSDTTFWPLLSSPLRVVCVPVGARVSLHHTLTGENVQPVRLYSTVYIVINWCESLPLIRLTILIIRWLWDYYYTACKYGIIIVEAVSASTTLITHSNLIRDSVYSNRETHWP